MWLSTTQLLEIIGIDKKHRFNIQKKLHKLAKFGFIEEKRDVTEKRCVKLLYHYKKK